MSMRYTVLHCVLFAPTARPMECVMWMHGVSDEHALHCVTLCVVCPNSQANGVCGCMELAMSMRYTVLHCVLFAPTARPMECVDAWS